MTQLKLPAIFYLALQISLNFCFAQSDDWKNEKSKSGIDVKSRLLKQDSKEGKIQVVEYKAATIAKVDFDRCVNILLDFNQHKHFLDNTEISKKIKTLSGNEWIAYYFIDTQWPIPDSDCVMKFKLEDNRSAGRIDLKGTVVPDSYEMKEVRRMTVSDVHYTVSQEANGFVTLEVSGKFSPVVYAPDWALRNWAPEGPARILIGIIALAQK